MKSDSFRVTKWKQPYTTVPNAVLEDEELDTYAKLAYVLLCKFADWHDKTCYPTLPTLGRLVGCSKPIVIRSIDTLEAKGYLLKEQGGHGVSNVYTLLDGKPRLPSSRSHGKQDLPRLGQPRLPQQDPLNEIHTSVNQEEREVLKMLKQVNDYPFDYQKDLDYIRTLSVDFADVDLLPTVKAWTVYKLDKPLKKKSNARSQLRRWFTNERKFSQERKGRQKRFATENTSKEEWGWE